MYSAAAERSETIDSGQPSVNNKLQRLNAEPVFALLVVVSRLFWALSKPSAPRLNEVE
jgi:hypothetical protein